MKNKKRKINRLPNGSQENTNQDFILFNINKIYFFRNVL